MAVAEAQGYLKLVIRVAGCADFEIELEPSATVEDAKLAATAGCDIDPESMRIVFRGKILRDDVCLASCGVKDKDALHIARGKPATQSVAPTVEEQSTTASASLQLVMKAPGGHERSVYGISADMLVEQLRAKAAAECGLTPEQIHLVHKAKMLKDGATLKQCGVQSGDVMRIARRAAPQAPGSTGSNASTVNEAVSAVAEAGPMPMAWGSGSGSLNAQQMHMMRELGFTGAMPEQVAAALQGGGGAGPRNLAAGLVRDEEREREERLHREVRIMEQHVRQLVRERLRIGPAGLPQQHDDREDPDDEEDPELMDEIARMMAEARSRGAPVPNASRFVDRALDRARARRAFHDRLRREAGDMDPDLEDAVAAAERMATAAERAPRRLGGAPRPPDSAGN